MPCRTAVWFTLALLAPLFVAPPASAQSPPTLDALLAAPVTAGTDALLVRHAQDPRVPRRWLEHLRHDDPVVRATTARALTVTGVVASIGRLRVALAAETDQRAAAEQALGLLILGDGAHDGYALGKLATADTSSFERGLLVVAASRPDTFQRQLAALRIGRADRAIPLVPALTRLSALGHEAVVRAVEADALAAGDRHVTDSVVMAAVERDLVLQPGTLRHAMGVRALRNTLAEYVAARHQRPGTPRDSGGYAFLADEEWATADVGQEADRLVVRELVRRWVGRAPDPTTLEQVRRVSQDGLLWSARLLDVLTGEERRALRKHLDVPPQVFGRLTPQGEPGRPVGHPVVLLAALPPGLILSLRDVTGCSATEKHDRFAEIAYGADGRARSVSLSTGAFRASLPDGCEAMLDAMTLLAYETLGSAYPGTRVAMVRLDEDFANCQREAAAAFLDTATLSGDDATSPSRLTNVQPVYPEVAVNKRDQGTVQLELELTSAGCVSSARVTGTVSPQLDAAALQAASRWLFQPFRHGERSAGVRVRTTAHFWLQ